jgi:hypothetical protein
MLKPERARNKARMAFSKLRYPFLRVGMIFVGKLDQELGNSNLRPQGNRNEDWTPNREQQGR